MVGAVPEGTAPILRRRHRRGGLAQGGRAVQPALDLDLTCTCHRWCVTTVQSNREHGAAHGDSATGTASAGPTSGTAETPTEAACPVLVVEDNPAHQLLAVE